MEDNMRLRHPITGANIVGCFREEVALEMSLER